jgi:hypothetical protein
VKPLEGLHQPLNTTSNTVCLHLRNTGGRQQFIASAREGACAYCQGLALALPVTLSQDDPELALDQHPCLLLPRARIEPGGKFKLETAHERSEDCAQCAERDRAPDARAPACNVGQ